MDCLTVVQSSTFPVEGLFEADGGGGGGGAGEDGGEYAVDLFKLFPLDDDSAVSI